MEPEVDLFTIRPEDKVPEKGKLLISEPFLPDTFFNRTVMEPYRAQRWTTILQYINYF